MTSRTAGVDYNTLDKFKRKAQRAARETAKNIKHLGNGEFRGLETYRGESAYPIETPDSYIAHVEEGLGTKNLVADEMYRLTGKTYYDSTAQDAVAAILNDLVSVGAIPISITMHVACGDSNWFKDEKRFNDLIFGWRNACHFAHCIWTGGETPILKKIVACESVMLSGSAIGIVKPKNRLIGEMKIRHGDAIVLVESSGIHSNGLTMARKIADSLLNGYLTKLSDGRTYGETLLDPTLIYAPFIKDCLDQNIQIHYAAHMTGHGWRKLMRPRQTFTYVIEHVPKPHLIFEFLQKHGPIDDEEAYGNFNMGAGFALYVSDVDVGAIQKIAASHKLNTLCAGHIEKSSKKRVLIKPKGLEYTTLGIR